MSAIRFARTMQAEVMSATIAYRVQLSRYTWAGIGNAPWVARMLRRYAGQADIRSVPIDWAGVISNLRGNGYTGAVPRSLRRWEP